ncbi:hypothetical protein HYS28_00015 [Candidatus Uhrbacteria bacterium]|nr:hypothetical protein [Candidatus Uhrbacteria bacterium]
MTTETAGTAGTDETIDPGALAEPTVAWIKLEMPEGFARGVVAKRIGDLKGKALTCRMAVTELLAHADNRTLLTILHEMTLGKRGAKDKGLATFARCVENEVAWRAEDVDAWDALKGLADIIKVPILAVKDSGELEKPVEAFKRIADALAKDPTFGSQAESVVAKAKARKAHAIVWMPEVSITDEVDYHQRRTRARLILGAPFGKLTPCQKSARQILEAIVEASGRKPRRILLAARRLSRKANTGDQEGLLRVLDVVFEQEAAHSKSADIRTKHGVLLDVARKLSTKEKPVHPQQFVGDEYEPLESAAKRLVILAGLHRNEIIKNAKSAIEAQLLAAKLSEAPKEEDEEESDSASTGS